MRGRILRHLGGLAGVAAIATGITLGASAETGDAAPRREATAVEEAQPLEAAFVATEDRPCLVVRPRTRRADAPRTPAGEDAGEAAGRTWSVRVVGPDEEPISGVRVVVQFKRWGNTSYPHQVGPDREAISDAAGLATLRVPEEARFAWVEAHPPDGWVAPAGVETRGEDPLADALRRVRFARSAAARRAPRADVVRMEGDLLGDVTLHLDRVAAVSGRVDVPDGFPARRVVVTARWTCPLRGAPAACSISCELDGTFQLPVPASAGSVDVEAQDSGCPEGSASEPFSVPLGPPAQVLSEGPLAEIYVCSRRAHLPGASAAPMLRFAADVVPTRVSGVAAGTWGLGLRLEEAASAPLEVVDEGGRRAVPQRMVVRDEAGRSERARFVGRPNGALLLTRLPPGTYGLVVSGEEGVARSVVDLPATRTTLIRLVRAELSGRVVGREDADGWYVEWLPRDASSPSASTRVQPDGSWRLPVEPGTRGRLVATCDVPDERAGWAEAEDVLAGRTDVVLSARGERTLAGRVVGIPARAYWDFRVHWTHGARPRVAEVAADGTFLFCGLPEGTAALDLWSQNAVVARWPSVAAGGTGGTFRFPMPGDSRDASNGAAEVGFTQDRCGR